MCIITSMSYFKLSCPTVCKQRPRSDKTTDRHVFLLNSSQCDLLNIHGTTKLTRRQIDM